jgi:hypothetical protein
VSASPAQVKHAESNAIVYADHHCCSVHVGAIYSRHTRHARLNLPSDRSFQAQHRHGSLTPQRPEHSPAMSTELPIEPVSDSPVFRASLSSLDTKASAIRKTCKNALQAAQLVHDLLEKLETAESELFDTLDVLKRQIVKVDTKGTTGLDHAGPGGELVRDLKAWKMNERTEERQRLEKLVTSRIRALRADMKVKGIGGGGTLNAFEV